MMDREMARQCFMDYVKDYDCTNPMISHKVTHTFHVEYSGLKEPVYRVSGTNDPQR